MTYGILAIASSRGSVWDKDEKLHRRWVAPLLKILMGFAVFEVVILITTIGFLIEGLFVSCHKYDDFQDSFIIVQGEIGNALNLTSQAIMGRQKLNSRKVYQGVLGLLLCHVTLMTLYCLYGITNTGKCRNLCWSLTLLCCKCVPKSKKNPMAKVGKLLDDLFPKDSFLTSDLIAGLSSLYLMAEEKDNVQRPLIRGIAKLIFYL